MVHIGGKIKERADDLGIGATKFGELLNRSRETVYDLFGRETVDTGLLLSCCKVLKHDFFQYYYDEEPLNVFREKASEEWEGRLHSLEQEIESKKLLLERNEELLALQRKYIAELEDKIERR